MLNRQPVTANGEVTASVLATGKVIAVDFTDGYQFAIPVVASMTTITQEQFLVGADVHILLGINTRAIS
jgi:hypothetical protein